MNIKDIAKLAGVSISTVSKVMNNKDDSIRKETRDRVLSIAKDYNYIPYSSVIVPNTKTYCIGVLLKNAAHKSRILGGFINKARTAGYNLLVSESANDMEEELKVIISFCSNHVDAVIWEPADSCDHSKAVSEMSESGIPYIIYNSPDEHSLNIDFSAYGYHAAKTLLDLGHLHIAFISAGTLSSDHLLDGVKKCMFDSSLSFSDDNIYDSIDESLIDQIIGHKISAIICSEYAQAINIYEYFTSLRFRIPYDFSIIAVRNDSYPEYSYPAISSYIIPYYQFGQYLCGQVVSLIENKDAAIDNFDIVVPLKNKATIDIPYSNRKKQLVVLGSINIDSYLNVPELPSRRNTVTTSVSFSYPGGKGMNTAVGAAKLGQHVSLIGNIGDDFDSALIVDTLKQYGIDSSGINRCSSVETGKAFIMVDPGGNSIMSILSGANALVSEKNITDNERLFRNCGYLLVSTEIPICSVVTACRLAHKYGGMTIIKPHATVKNHLEFLKQTDILIPNFDELCELCPGDDTISHKASLLLDKGISAVIVTLGADGCFLKTDKLEKSYPASKFQSVDNTGACDAFISAFASYLQFGYDIDTSIRIATYAAGFSITREGVVPSLVDRNTLENYICKYEEDLIRKV